MTSDSTMVRPLQGEREIDAYSAILAASFASSVEEVRAWIVAGGVDQVRVALRSEAVRGGLLLIPMGQFFGGRSVPMTGIAGVGVPPEHRGTGIAAALMRGTLNELAEARVALSALFASTAVLYRALGYELAGGRFRVRVQSRDVSLSERKASVRTIDAADQPAIERAYRRYAADRAGYLDRGAYVWGRVRKPNSQPASGYLVEADGQIQGYVYFTPRRTRGVHHDVACSDFVALTPDAGRRLLSLLSDLRSLGDEISWCTGPADALLLQLPDHAYRMELVEHWMLRIVNVEAALAVRGYPASCRAELHLDVVDQSVLLNQRRYVLFTEHGRAEVRRGGSGALKCDVRGLAALYAGFLSPEALRRAGLLEGDETTLSVARDLFGGPAPAMSDAF